MTDLLALVVQQSVNGIYLGCLYVMVALGLTLIYGVLNQINFAHADFVTVGAFAAFFTATRFATKALGIPDTGAYLLSLFSALGAGALLGWLVSAAVFAPLRRRGADELRPLIATIGVSVLLENGQLALFGPIPYQFDSPLARETIRFGPIFFSGQSALVVAVSVAAIAALYAFMIRILQETMACETNGRTLECVAGGARPRRGQDRRSGRRAGRPGLESYPRPLRA